MDPEQRIQAMQSYYAATSFMDAQVGQVLHTLEESGQAENTLVVFWADHGWQLGQHGQWEKKTLFEAATRVPLIFAGAGVPLRGAVCRRTVEHLDLYPTIASMCGLDGVPSNLHGESLCRCFAIPRRNGASRPSPRFEEARQRREPRLTGTAFATSDIANLVERRGRRRGIVTRAKSLVHLIYGFDESPFVTKIGKAT